jgi:hypothetical protein
MGAFLAPAVNSCDFWGMSLRFLAPVLALLLLPAATVMARERVEEKTFSTNGIPALNISAYHGSITVESSADNEVRVKVTAYSLLEQSEAADRALGRLQLDWRQEGDTITLAAANPRETAVQFLWQQGDRLELDIAVTVPRSCSLNLVTGNGAVRVGDITGNVRVKTGTGLIFCRHIDGGLVAEADYGDIVVSACTGNVNLTTKSGFVRTGPIRGKAVVSTVNGDIDLLCVNGGLVAHADAGDVTAGIPRRVSGPASVRADGGSITLKIDPSADVDISASSVWGRVRAMPANRPGLPLVTESGGLGRRAIVARVNAGGTIIDARANGGHVNLMGEVPPFS